MHKDQVVGDILADSKAMRFGLCLVGYFGKTTTVEPHWSPGS